MDSPVQEAQVQDTLARSALYRFLSVALLPPGEAFMAVAADEAVGATVRRAAQQLGRAEVPRAVGAACESLRTTSGPVLEEAYHRIFGHNIGKDCPLNETQYGPSHVFQQAQQLADIAGFYQAFGLEVAETVGERVDHISIELEFMHVLTFREAYARVHHGPDEVGLLRDAQRGFLQDHLSLWVPAFARLVGRRDGGFYGHIADLCAVLIGSDAAAFGLSPAEEMEFAPPASVDPEDNTLACGGSCPSFTS